MLFVNPGTRIDAYEENVPLPYGRDDPFRSDGGPDEIYTKAAFCFLAHIRIRQTLNRSKETRTPNTQEEEGKINFSVIGALFESLHAWYDTLPTAMRFPPTIDYNRFPETRPLVPVIDDNLSWLRTFYFSCYGVFVWPVVMEAVSFDGPITDNRFVEAVQHMAYSISGVIASISQYMNGKFHPIVWTHSQVYVILIFV